MSFHLHPVPPGLAWATASFAAVLMLAPGVSAADLTIIAHNDGPPGSHNESPFWFEVAGQSRRNPDLALRPGPLHIEFRNAGDRLHSLVIDAPWGGRTKLIPPNGSATLDVVVPTEDASGFYYCDAHQEIGMAGNWTLGTAVAGRPPSIAQGGAKIPGLGLGSALAIIACAAAILRRRAT